MSSKFLILFLAFSTFFGATYAAESPLDILLKNIIKHNSKISFHGVTIEVINDNESLFFENKIKESVDFLNNIYGKPIEGLKAVRVIVSTNHKSHALTQFPRLGYRDIHINANNFVGINTQYLVHELFHALYQHKIFIEKNKSISESHAYFTQLYFLDDSVTSEQLISTLEGRFGAKNIARMRHDLQNSELQYAIWLYPLLKANNIKQIIEIIKANKKLQPTSDSTKRYKP